VVGVGAPLPRGGGGPPTTRLGALNGSLTAAPLGLAAGLGQHGLETAVTPSGSTGAVELTSPGITLKLSDLLPANVLNALPLGTLLQLLGSTGIQLPANLGGAVTQLENVVLGVQVLGTDLTNLANAQATVASLSGSNPAVAAAQAAVTSAQQSVTSAQAAVTAAQSKLGADQATQTADQTAVTAACLVPLSAACTAAQSALAALNSTVAGDQSALAGAQSTLTTNQATLAQAQAALTAATTAAATAGSPLATAEGLVTSLTGTVNGLLTQLQGVLNGLPNVQSLLQQLAAALGNAPLLQVGNVSVVLNTAATAKSGASSVTCTLGSVTVLGTAVAAPTCSSLGQLVSGIESKLTSALAVLPAAARPSVTLDGLQPTSSSAAAPTSAGATSASAGLSALHLAIAPISLQGLADSLTAQLKAQLNQVLGALGVAAPAVRAHALSAHALPVTLPAGLSALLSTVTSQIDALPTGSALAGLSTLGLDAHLVGVSSQAAFQGGSTPVASSAAPTAGAPAGSSTATPAGHLAFTGGNELGMLAGGLLLVVVGAQMLVVRREQTA
jgi:trimeric autotransporter adhesin